MNGLCADDLTNEHTARCIDYLRAFSETLCVLGNFQKPKVEWKRIVDGFRNPDALLPRKVLRQHLLNHRAAKVGQLLIPAIVQEP